METSLDRVTTSQDRVAVGVRSLNEAVDGPGPWLEWHHDRFEPPPGAEVLATTDSAVQLFTLGRMAGTQFHPEVDVEHIEGWMLNVDDEYLERHGVDRIQVLREIRENEAHNIEQCKRLVDWFLDEVAFA